MQRHAHAKQPNRPPRLRCERPLGGQGRRHGVRRTSEDGEQAIAGTLHHRATVGRDAGTQQGVVARQRATHRVGLPHNSNDNKLEAGADPKALRASLAQVGAICAPNTCHAYQNIAFDTASEIVQRVTGVPYTEEVRRRIFAPLGMQNASLTRAGLMSARSWARPHIGRRTVEVNDNYYRIPAAGGVNSSVMDMALWMRAQMGLAPQVVPERVLDTIHQARVSTERRVISVIDSLPGSNLCRAGSQSPHRRMMGGIVLERSGA